MKPRARDVPPSDATPTSERERGQAIVEYVLLVATLVIALAAVYSAFAGDFTSWLDPILRRLGS